jgi:DNA-binding MarR family transcriptional regulator
MTDEQQHDGNGELLIYRDDSGGAIRVLLEGETVWLTQAQIAELYQTTPQNVTQHLKAIYDEGELDEAATCKQYFQVRREGKRDISRRLKHYRLVDACMARELLPHVRDAWAGYEIPFNRHFYGYKPPRPLDKIETETPEMEGEIAGLLKGVAG